MLHTEPAVFPVKNKLENEQLFKLSRFKEVIKRTKPHRHDGYFELIVLLEGSGFHWVDTKLMPIAPPMAFFLSPGQLHCWQLTSVPKGFVVMFRADFIDPKHSADLYPLAQQLERKREVLLPQPAPFADLLTAIETEYQNPSRHSLVILRAMTQILLARLLEADQQEFAPARTGDLTFRRFIDLLRQPGHLAHRVFYYADLLGVSPQHLNTICRRMHGKSAGELITEQIILEGKRHLLHTDQSITEVAEQLGFADPSHFVKYFKKITGHTPASFRKLSGF
ncbi:AraC family transcriptional regulator [Larkinella rosea]|uniref:Helix-turn-helix domain-containing protein n=1 Tax=Larkinella rosea TaxID=2025312 RepID=A0A3P1C266_9BACT|nr:helix-turn-helix domain-containing protein [Larkinella rosea]RRB07500.1 helix-turn-helix domain-containing protein [Larkinella rosea]